ncbi:virion core protein, T7 gp14 family [Burkholderia singularis]|uniref:virion core protein, T7 gp14 family n=2 Tax=Burkholderia TaxID=32008 RepID=UPI003CC65B6E
MLAVTAASAVVQSQMQNRSIEAQAESANKNLEMSYLAAQDNQRALDEQAFEQRTDRARAAARQLAQARVLAAQGGGSLAAMAVNITGAEADDFSRIDASTANQQSTIRSQMGASAVSNQSAMSGFAAQGRAGAVGAGAAIANAAVSVGSMYYSNVQQENTAKALRSNRPYLTVGN